MGRKKKIPFKLNPEWMLKEPLDFEYNKYTLLDYLQKCEKNFDNFEIYPDFVELSLHLANMQSLYKENTLLLTDKKLKSCDDEIMLKDLYPKKPRDLSEEEEEELDKTIKYSNHKLFDTFNLGKSIWNLAFDSIEVTLKKNKANLMAGSGYVFFYSKKENKIHVWEFRIKKERGTQNSHKNVINKIYESNPEDITLLSIMEKYSTFNKETEHYKTLPVFEMQCHQDFPMEQTVIPIMKRKVMSYIFQVVNLSKIKNFDS
jgi:hypothetical protein